MCTGVETCTDFLGQEIKAGDDVVYPGRKGSGLWMNLAKVVSVDPKGQDGWRVKVQLPNNAIRIVTCVDRVVVIHPPAE
jgi:hypothetical protein